MFRFCEIFVDELDVIRLSGPFNLVYERINIQWSYHVELHVIEAVDLKVGDIFTSDPFVRISFMGNKFRTGIDTNTLNPEWDEKFTFTVSNLSGPMQFKIEDKDLFGEDSLGEASLDLSKLNISDVEQGDIAFKNDLWLDLRNGSGKLHVVLYVLRLPTSIA
eukprot:TRINITY_DN2315_c0_g1_i1.p1 TRINITY_DN2315_c0_g1~~TRINITY_DN2315_c0_g1_i1.p1  ORF type:complete len:162 (-),score=28.46 TRINITY_DN2315_c0_g1_i1:69-554(-)